MAGLLIAGQGQLTSWVYKAILVCRRSRDHADDDPYPIYPSQVVGLIIIEITHVISHEARRQRRRIAPISLDEHPKLAAVVAKYESDPLAEVFLANLNSFWEQQRNRLLAAMAGPDRPVSPRLLIAYCRALRGGAAGADRTAASRARPALWAWLIQGVAPMLPIDIRDVSSDGPDDTSAKIANARLDHMMRSMLCDSRWFIDAVARLATENHSANGKGPTDQLD